MAQANRHSNARRRTARAKSKTANNPQARLGESSALARRPKRRRVTPKGVKTSGGKSSLTSTENTMNQANIDISHAVKTTAKVALGKARHKGTPALDRTYQAWQAGRAIRTMVDQSDDSVAEEWVDQHTERARKAMDGAARRMISIPAITARDLARKMEVVADEAEYYHGNLEQPYRDLAKSVYEDALRHTRAGAAEIGPQKDGIDYDAIRRRLEMVQGMGSYTGHALITDAEIGKAMHRGTGQHLIDFCIRYDQSLDWVICGDIGGMIASRLSPLSSDAALIPALEGLLAGQVAQCRADEVSDLTSGELAWKTIHAATERICKIEAQSAFSHLAKLSVALHITHPDDAGFDLPGDTNIGIMKSLLSDLWRIATRERPELAAQLRGLLKEMYSSDAQEPAASSLPPSDEPQTAAPADENKTEPNEPLVALGHELQALWDAHHSLDELGAERERLHINGADAVLDTLSSRIHQLEEAAPAFRAETPAGAIVALLMLGTISRVCADEASVMAEQGCEPDKQLNRVIEEREAQIEALLYSVMGVLRKLSPGSYESCAGRVYLGDQLDPFNRKNFEIPKPKAA